MWVVLGCVLLTVAFAMPVHPRITEHRRGRTRKKRVKRTSKKTGEKFDVALMLSEVATRLRSGSSIEQAWNKTILRIAGANGVGSVETGLDENGVPQMLHHLWEGSGGKGWKKLPGAINRRDIGTQIGIPSAVAVCRLTRSSGAPAAEVFDSCAGGVAEVIEAAAERRVALAGTQATARMLAWLPLLGLGLGWALGADPVGFLLGNTFGKMCLVAGVAFECVGLAWVKRLSKKAQESQ